MLSKLGLVLLLMPLTALAETIIVEAPVIHVEPHYKQQRTNYPDTQCYQERSNRSGSDSYTPEITGGIVGAILGNQVGGGSGKKIATVAGAVLGTSVGHDWDNNRSTQGTEQRCTTRNNYAYEEVPAGYDVTYRLLNQRFTTRTNSRPGRSIRVRVTVSPAQNRY